MTEYVGTGEIQKLHGITRVQVFRLIAAGDFPEPVAQTGGGRVWEAQDVEQAIERLRRAGRITSDNRLVPHRYMQSQEASA